MSDLYLIMDQRGILEPDEATVLCCAESLDEAIDDCRTFGGGCVWSTTPAGLVDGKLRRLDGALEYWLDGGEEWRADDV